ncbi:MAG: hypothetical protein F6K62_04480 [Sphaerospermopsis sp. SIO1G2]|nr:hypothetical protein [Sphaerospermopsis sp. SIO1G2]
MNTIDSQYKSDKIKRQIPPQLLCIVSYFALALFISNLQPQKIGVQFPNAPSRGCPASTIAGGTRVSQRNLLDMENVSKLINN